jgi:hypothetical protein
MRDRETLKRLLLAVAALIDGTGCATFANVRSADVDRGSSVQLEASASGHPGAVAGWFWSLDCSNLCPTAAPPGLDLNYTYGWRAGDSGPPVSLGAGVASLDPYAEGFVQLSESKRRPFGIGARVGGGRGYAQQHLYGRMDFPLSPEVRVLWNPGFFHLTEATRDGFSTAAFDAMTQGVALQFGDGGYVVTPSVAAVWGTATHRSAGSKLGPETKLFWTVGVGFGFRRDPR